MGDEEIGVRIEEALHGRCLDFEECGAGRVHGAPDEGLPGKEAGLLYEGADLEERVSLRDGYPVALGHAPEEDVHDIERIMVALEDIGACLKPPGLSGERRDDHEGMRIGDDAPLLELPGYLPGALPRFDIREDRPGGGDGRSEEGTGVYKERQDGQGGYGDDEAGRRQAHARTESR